MLAAAVIMIAIAGAIGTVLALAQRWLPQSADSPVERINALLPQSQCGQCGYPGCRPYAEAVADGAAGTDQCAPGGDATATALANLLGKTPRPVNPAYGIPGAAGVAVIDESACIGCTLCIAACPVDAILGSQQYSHTVIRSECTGCELCVAPCPVDCIHILPARSQAA